MDVTTIADRQLCSKCQGDKRTICPMCNGTKESKHIGVDACELCDDDGKNACNTCGASGFEIPQSFNQVIAWYAKGHRAFPNAKLAPTDTLFRYLELRGVSMRDASLSGLRFSRVDFSGSDLAAAKLDGTFINDSNFAGTNLESAKGSGVRLYGTNFTGANLHGVVFPSGDFLNSVFENANLRSAKLNDAELEQTNLSGADLVYANLDGAKLRLANVVRAKLSNATLIGTNLHGADLTSASLREATLEKADLRSVKGLELDSTYIMGARFRPGANDKWSTLRRNYTGPMFAFHFFILICFLTPYALRTVYWTFVNRVQTVATETAKQLSDKLETSNATTSGLRVPDQTEIMLSAIKSFSPCFSPECQSVPIWHLLLGLDRGILAFFPIALIVYNVFRGILTWRVSLLRAEEERSGYSPALASYRWLYWLHWAFMGLLVLAVGSILWHLWEWHQLKVWVPVSTINVWNLPTWLPRLVGA
ncbi:pentapeptide repeat-containing protein [Reyranella sp.]|uniref:pentapeptide repeat-containing protein n=1 Tax=Reyranella sp. TaxID=1929291 RepID=UPI00272FC71E|nr:pentapeptide repeat-containing protein [Reyranella sp.]MDP2372446.1 pentapeptide repeat-containing protein [Reyranella sp.]